MNANIKIMIELQRLWQNVLREERLIESHKKSLSYWKDELSAKKDVLQKLDEDVKNLKSDIKKNELALNELEEKLKKLDSRKLNLTKEKELTAINHEIDSVKSEKDDIEENLILSMDDLSDKEQELSGLSDELQQFEKQLQSDIESITEKMNKSEAIIKENNDKFSDLEPSLDSKFRSRFTKILKAKSGIGVAEVIDDVCSGCNFQIPPSLSIEASKPESMAICTNCGRFIYK